MSTGKLQEMGATTTNQSNSAVMQMLNLGIQC